MWGAHFEDICCGCLIDGYVLKRMDVMCDCMLIIWIFLIVESEGPVRVFSGFLKHRFEENKFNLSIRLFWYPMNTPTKTWTFHIVKNDNLKGQKMLGFQKQAGAERIMIADSITLTNDHFPRNNIFLNEACTTYIYNNLPELWNVICKWGFHPLHCRAFIVTLTNNSFVGVDMLLKQCAITQ